MEPLAFFIGITHILGLTALVVVVFSWCIRVFDRKPWKKIMIGIIFAAVGLLAMMDPIAVAPGVQSDARLPLLVVSYSYGGLPATIIVTASLLFGRFMVGGGGAWAGELTIVAAALLGIAYAKLVRNRKLRPRWRRVLLAAATSTSMAIGLLALGPLLSTIAISHILILMFFNMLVAVLFDEFLRYQKRSYAAQRLLETEATTDPLTRLKNRRAFTESAERLLADIGSGAVIMFDIDHFKSINDTHGHDVGDAVLREIAMIVQSAIRKGDLVARYGGEEIIAFIPGADKTVATAIADTVRAKIQAHAFHGAHALRLTLSAGTADGSDSLATLTKRADEALYAAKRKGRNRVEFTAAA